MGSSRVDRFGAMALRIAQSALIVLGMWWGTASPLLAQPQVTVSIDPRILQSVGATSFQVELVGFGVVFSDVPTQCMT